MSLLRLSPLEGRIHRYVISTPPAGGLPVSLDLVKQWLAIDPTDTSQDAILTLLIEAAMAAIERFTGLTLVITGFTTQRDFFVQDEQLRKAPLVSVERVSRLVNGVDVEVNSTTYAANYANEVSYGHMYLLEDKTWPTDADIREDAIKIEFTAGLAATPDALPSAFKLALLQAMADAYQNRGDCGGACEDLGKSLSARAASLLTPYRILEI